MTTLFLLLQSYGHPRVLGIPIPKTLVIWASPSHIILAIWVGGGGGYRGCHITVTPDSFWAATKIIPYIAFVQTQERLVAARFSVTERRCAVTISKVESPYRISAHTKSD